MRSFLVNKNLSLYYWLKKRIGKNLAFRIVNKIEKVITILGREEMPKQRESALQRVYREKQDMINQEIITYKFYLRDAIKGIGHIGVLPERRRNPERITYESIINWGRKYFGKNVKDEDIFFIETVLEDD